MKHPAEDSPRELPTSPFVIAAAKRLSTYSLRLLVGNYPGNALSQSATEMTDITIPHQSPKRAGSGWRWRLSAKGIEQHGSGLFTAEELIINIWKSPAQNPVALTIESDKEKISQVYTLCQGDDGPEGFVDGREKPLTQLRMDDIGFGIDEAAQRASLYVFEPYGDLSKWSLPANPVAPANAPDSSLAEKKSQH